METRNLRKERIGIVTSNKMEKSIVVAEVNKVKHPMYGKPVSEEHRKKISNALKGKTRKKITCPHCSKLGGNNNMKRWHFSNCREIA